MKEDGQISVPLGGMNRDAHVSRLKNTEVAFALNSNTEHESGGQTTHKNEPSNYLSVIFPEGYKVISYKKHLPSNKVYYWLTNPQTKKSSIGYVESVLQDVYNDDEYTDCQDCQKNKRVVEKPLEEITQVPDSTYVELVNDICLPIGEGLNFDINKPIKFLHIKTEKGQTTAYWNDYNNPPRFMVLSDVSYLFTVEVPCEDDQQSNCLQPEKLLQFPNHTRIKVVADKVQTGGNLKFGKYEFYAAYCDSQGNNLTNYSTPTNPVDIFDENNNILTQTDLDTYTNFAIRLKIENLDEKFKYYKVVCVERSSVDSTQSVFLEGIHPTTDDTVLYTSSGSSSDSIYSQSGNHTIRKRMDLQELFQVRPTYDKAVGTMSSGGRQFMWGLYKRPEVNLQPVVNLFGALMKWQSSVAKEDLYKSAIATSRFKGWMRNEVQPFALRFFYKNGDYTSAFPIISRPSIGTDKDKVDINSDTYKSLSENTPKCTGDGRTENWQIFNTATQDGICEDFSGNATEIQEKVKRTCKINGVGQVPSNTVNIEIDVNYTNISDYVNDNYDEIIDSTSDLYLPEIAAYLTADYSEQHCSPNFQGDCEEATLIKETIQLGEVTNEENKYVDKCMEDYLKSLPPDYCSLYKTETTTGEFERDVVFEETNMPCYGAPLKRPAVYKRDGNFENENCAYAPDILNNNSPQQQGQTFFHNYKGDAVQANLLTNKSVTYTSQYFKSNLHKGALFYRIKKNGRDKLIFEVTKKSECDKSDDIGTSIKQMRYTFYAKCKSTEALPINIISPDLNCDYSEPTAGLINTDEGLLVRLDVSSYPEEFYVAMDDPIVSVEVPNKREEVLGQLICTEGSVTKYRTAPSCGCYTIYTRDEEYSSVDVSWDSMEIDKTEEYERECTFFIPKVDDCDPVPYAYGKFAYNESVIEYPDNPELYDSSKLRINSELISLLKEEDKNDFINYFTYGEAPGYYTLKEETDFRCKPIRHPKMPDNSKSPFMSDLNSAPFSEALIFPLGVTIDNGVIQTILRVALHNGLIDQKQFDSIDGFEILKGDNTVHKSVIANGLGYDMYKYNKKDNEYIYANYPHNDLGKDLLHYKDESRKELIDHPYGSTKNNRFSIISPDLLLTRPSIPTEAVISGYQMGSSNNIFTDVEEHPKWTILGKNARTTARVLAIAEFAIEVAMKSTEFITQGGSGNLWFVGGFAIGSNAVGAGISSVATIAYIGLTAAQGFISLGKYRYEWLKTFRDLGTAYNFTSYAVSHGHHNNFIKNNNNDSYIRGLTSRKYLKKGRYTVRDKNSTADKLHLNNFLREDSTFISTGDYFFDYPTEYYTHDNNNLSIEQGSRAILSQNGCDSGIETQRNVGSPYITLKNYVPDQFGSIDSVKWLTTNEIFSVGETTSCKTIFGGNVSISRFTWKRKLPIFTRDIVGTADRLPFNYYDYKNIGYPRFYCNYEEDTRYTGFLIPFPDIDSNYNFDCQTGDRSFYVRPPSKLYLYSYGITDFLVESEINCNFRYGGKELKNQFYPQTGDMIEWTQQKNVPITEPNTFFYNNTYSLPVSNTPFKYLDNTYSKKLWEMRSRQDNAVIMSEADNSENEITDPWLIFKPLNWYEFKKDKGKLISLKDLENGQILANFEDGQSLFNTIDNLAEKLTPQTKELGIGSIFGGRPLEFKMTDLGFAGTQHSDMLSTPYGHFKVDAKRGKVFNIDQNGQNLEVISENSGNNPSGMKNWFKEHLPFKLLKTFPELDVDNKYKGIGISLGWDERFGRLFMTKRDYRIKNSECLKYEEGVGFYTDCRESSITCPEGYTYNESTGMCEIEFTMPTQCLEGCEKVTDENNVEYCSCVDSVPPTYVPEKILIGFDNEDYFEDVSWTISYKPSEASWQSYWTFKPDYYVNHLDFFQSGFNSDGHVWSHYLGNQSFQVFQGKKEPWIVEVPLENNNIRKILSAIYIDVEAKRYNSEWDYTENSEVGFNKMIIFNGNNHSGKLNLNLQKTLRDINKYPKTNGNISQDILFTTEDGKHTVDYFYNRVKNQNNNVPLWNWDYNKIEKNVNPAAISFYGKKPLERMRGDQFIVRLEQDSESRYAMELKNVQAKVINYQ